MKSVALSIFFLVFFVSTSRAVPIEIKCGRGCDNCQISYEIVESFSDYDVVNFLIANNTGEILSNIKLTVYIFDRFDHYLGAINVHAEGPFFDGLLMRSKKFQIIKMPKMLAELRYAYFH